MGTLVQAAGALCVVAGALVVLVVVLALLPVENGPDRVAKSTTTITMMKTMVTPAAISPALMAAIPMGCYFFLVNLLK
jgi:hypothetical protein